MWQQMHRGMVREPQNRTYFRLSIKLRPLLSFLGHFEPISFVFRQNHGKYAEYWIHTAPYLSRSLQGQGPKPCSARDCCLGGGMTQMLRNLLPRNAEKGGRSYKKGRGGGKKPQASKHESAPHDGLDSFFEKTLKADGASSEEACQDAGSSGRNRLARSRDMSVSCGFDVDEAGGIRMHKDDMAAESDRYNEKCGVFGCFNVLKASHTVMLPYLLNGAGWERLLTGLLHDDAVLLWHGRIAASRTRRRWYGEYMFCTRSTSGAQPTTHRISSHMLETAFSGDCCQEFCSAPPGSRIYLPFVVSVAQPVRKFRAMAFPKVLFYQLFAQEKSIGFTSETRTSHLCFDTLEARHRKEQRHPY
jgi:hypothetical protein